MMRCPSCAAEINSNSVFCLNCGAKLPTPKPEEAPAYAPPAYAAPAPAPAPAPAAEAEPPAYSAPQNNTSAAGVTYTAPAYTPPTYAEQPKGNYGGGNSGGNFGGGPVPPPQPASKPVFFGERTAPVISTKNWLGTMLLLALIPLVLGIISGFVGKLLGTENIVTTIVEIIAALSGIILIFIMAFNRRVNPSKRNFFRATLWLFLISLVIIVVLCILLFTVFRSAITSLGGLGELTEILEEFGGMDLGQYI